MLEMGPRAELGKACSERLAAIRSFVLRLTTEAGARDSEQAARQIQMLMQGSIVARTAGDREAARRMKEVARLILRQQLDPPASQ